jgi:hypothetical protein
VNDDQQKNDNNIIFNYFSLPIVRLQLAPTREQRQHQPRQTIPYNHVYREKKNTQHN